MYVDGRLNLLKIWLLGISNRLDLYALGSIHGLTENDVWDKEDG